MVAPMIQTSTRESDEIPAKINPRAKKTHVSFEANTLMTIAKPKAGINPLATLKPLNTTTGQAAIKEMIQSLSILHFGVFH